MFGRGRPALAWYAMVFPLIKKLVSGNPVLLILRDNNEGFFFKKKKITVN
jgi:hypothetical protein